MRVGSLFSGIGGFDLGLERAGMQVAWQVEKDARCREVLERGWPDVPRHEDVRHVGAAELSPVDLLCGGFPCQDVSVAGAREGLAGERSGLFYQLIRIAREIAPRWVLIENVPGLLSSNDGRDMGTVLGTLADCGYGWCYRVLDSQHFGVPHRRDRVFIVGRRGGPCPPEVLFEPESVQGDPRTHRPRRPGHARRAEGSAREGGRDSRVAVYTKARRSQSENEPESWDVGETCPTLDAGGHTPRTAVIAFSFTPISGQGTDLRVARTDVSNALSPTSEGEKTDRGVRILQDGIPRRLTPLECERLQGLPEGWTKGFPLSVRYKQIGNAVTVPVAEWIGKRIVRCDARASGGLSTPV